MDIKWERSEDSRFEAFRCFNTDLPLFKTARRKEVESLPLFEHAGITVNIDSPDEYLKEVGRIGYRMRLPYTREMLERRKADGNDIPDWLT